MDKKKVTRRAAMATAAGGLAASPFVLRALRARYNVKIPESKFTEEWNICFKVFDVPIEATTGPDEFTLSYSHRCRLEVP